MILEYYSKIKLFNSLVRKLYRKLYFYSVIKKVIEIAQDVDFLKITFSKTFIKKINNNEDL